MAKVKYSKKITACDFLNDDPNISIKDSKLV